MEPFLQLEVMMLLKVRKRYLFKNIKQCFQAFGKPFKILPIDRCQPLTPLELHERCTGFFQRILGDPVKIEMVYKGNQRSKKFQLASFSQDQKRETKRNPKILATSQMDKMAPVRKCSNFWYVKTRCKRRSSARAILSLEQIL